MPQCRPSQSWHNVPSSRVEAGRHRRAARDAGGRNCATYWLGCPAPDTIPVRRLPSDLGHGVRCRDKGVLP